MDLVRIKLAWFCIGGAVVSVIAALVSLASGCTHAMPPEGPIVMTTHCATRDAGR